MRWYISRSNLILLEVNRLGKDWNVMPCMQALVWQVISFGALASWMALKKVQTDHQYPNIYLIAFFPHSNLLKKCLLFSLRSQSTRTCMHMRAAWTLPSSGRWPPPLLLIVPLIDSVCVSMTTLYLGTPQTWRLSSIMKRSFPNAQ